MHIPQPENFDVLGALAFLAIIVIAIYGLIGKEPLEDWAFWFLLAIGILGFVVDLSIVYLYLV